MVFLLQHTQNRDSRALHLKLDELLRSIDAARDKIIDLENCTDEEIDKIERAIFMPCANGAKGRPSRQRLGIHLPIRRHGWSAVSRGGGAHASLGQNAHPSSYQRGQRRCRSGDQEPLWPPPPP